MSDAKLIDSAGIPQFTGNLEQLELDATTLTAEAILFRVNGALVHSNFQGLSPFYQAPEAEELFATTAPVATKTDAFADDLEKVSQALTTYADEVRPLAARLKSLQTEASSFYCNDVAGDEDWREDKDKVQHNNDLWHDVNSTMDAFWAAERACHNKITALVGGIQLKASDGENNCGTYGYKAEDLNHAESTPWGAPVDREYTGWAAVGHNIKSFVWDGFIVDGVWGTIKGLGTLVGTDGWKAAGQAWTGLAKLATGLAITLSPAGAAYWMAPKDKLPSWLRDSRTAVTETGKALVAYDQWGKNPARAAGAVSFNVITTVATGGAGAAAKSGAAAKAISVAGKAGRLVDPITYIGKAGKFGAVKVGDLFGSLKNLNTGAYNDILSGQGKLQPDGTVVKIPDRVEVLPDNTLKYVTEKGETRYLTREGALLDEQHKVLVQHVDEVKIQSTTSDRVGGQAEPPALRDPVREPAMAGGRAGEGATGVTGRTGDELPGGAVNRPPSGSASDLPGRADNHVSGGAADRLGRDPSTSHESPSGPPRDGSTPAHGDHGARGNSHDTGAAHQGAETTAPGHSGAEASHGQPEANAHGAGDDGQLHNQPGGHDSPAPGPGEKVLDELDDSRVVRADGLITHVDGRPVADYLDDIARGRGAAYRAAKEAGTFPRKQTGACVGAVVDLRTGTIVEGINGKADAVIPVDELHPTLAERYDSIGTPPPHNDHPLGHAEVKAANELLWARTKQGLPDGDSALAEMRAAVEFPYLSDKATGAPGRPAPFCANCNHMLHGVPSSHGRFTGYPPSDENWIQ
ncbi:hypothetical protein ACWGH5_02260 [Streptomyces sp. NPDC054864]